MFTYEEWLEETGKTNDEDTYFEYLAYVETMSEWDDMKTMIKMNYNEGVEIWTTKFIILIMSVIMIGLV